MSTSDSGQDAPFESRVAIDLWNSNRYVCPSCGAVILPVVHKGLPERGVAVETAHSTFSEVIHHLGACDSKQVKIRIWLENQCDCVKGF